MSVNKTHPITIIGITGGIGSGKSTVADMFGELGAEVLNADKLCHQLIKTETVKNKILETWPDIIDDNTGMIARKKLAELVFSNTENVKKLNNILHPLVIAQIEQRINELKNNSIVVIDAALIEESELSHICNFTVFVDTEKELRVERCTTDRNWDIKEIDKRERYQIDTRIKKVNADAIIYNDKSKEETKEQARKLWVKFINPEK